MGWFRVKAVQSRTEGQAAAGERYNSRNRIASDSNCFDLVIFIGYIYIYIWLYLFFKCNIK